MNDKMWRGDGVARKQKSKFVQWISTAAFLIFLFLIFFILEWFEKIYEITKNEDLKNHFS